MQRTARPAALVALACLGALLTAGSSPVSANRAADAASHGYYVATADRAHADRLGCHQAGRSGRISLFFGEPRLVGGAYGASLWDAPDLTLDQIEEWVKWFVAGYARCRATGDFLYVGVGTSNAGIDAHGWIREHGLRWAASVAQLDAWSVAHHPDAVRVRGAYHAQPGWASFEQTHRWIQGYSEDYRGWRYLHYTGSASGGWSQAQVWHLTGGHQIALVQPPPGQVTAWRQVAGYGYRHHGGTGLHIAGAVSLAWFIGDASAPAGCAGTPIVGHVQRDLAGVSAAQPNSELMFQLRRDLDDLVREGAPA
jgi:hypothetical protein